MRRRRPPEERMRRVLWGSGWTQTGDGYGDPEGGQETWTSEPNEYGAHRCVLTWRSAGDETFAEAEVSQWTYRGIRIRLAYTDGVLAGILLGIAADDLGYVLAEEVGGPVARWLGRVMDRLRGRST